MVKIKVCCRCNDYHKNMIEVHRVNGGDFTDITYKCETCEVETVLRLSFDEGIDQYEQEAEETVCHNCGNKETIAGVICKDGITRRECYECYMKEED